jgi:hypothetical protein
LREDNPHDAAQLLRVSAWLLSERDAARARRLARTLVADSPTAANIVLLAELELACGAVRESRILARAARRRARREGALGLFRRATEIAQFASKPTTGHRGHRRQPR